ncbi:hypothetical protein ACOSQ2_009997 [Xanthoceras sorbifolium]
MEKPIKLVDDFRREGDLLPLDYHRTSCKEIDRPLTYYLPLGSLSALQGSFPYHRGIELPNQSLVGIIGMLHNTVPLLGPDDLRNHCSIHCLNVNTAL